MVGVIKIAIFQPPKAWQHAASWGVALVARDQLVLSVLYFAQHLIREDA